MHGITSFVEGYWWLVFVIPPVLGGSLQQHHRRRLAILAAKGKLAETKSQALQHAARATAGLRLHPSSELPQPGHLGVRGR